MNFDPVVIGGVATVVGGTLAKLYYDSPNAAWRRLARAQEERIAAVERRQDDLEKRVKERDDTIGERDRAIGDRDGVIRRLRAYVAVLQQLMHDAGLPMPAPMDADAGIAPERRSPTLAVDAATIHLEPKEQ